MWIDVQTIAYEKWWLSNVWYEMNVLYDRQKRGTWIDMNMFDCAFACDLKGLLTGYSSHCKYDRGRCYWLTAY